MDWLPLYPFGYGLSYTSFSMEPVSCSVEDGQVRVLASVINTGSKEGKETVQVYVSVKGNTELDHPALELKGYAKTKLLAPGEKEEVCVTIPVQLLASYSEKKAAWILEKGSYAFFLGTDVRSASELEFHYVLEADRIVRRLVSRMAPTQLSMRLRADGSYENLPLGEPNDPRDSVLEWLPYEQMDGCMPEVRYQPHTYTSWTGKTNGLPKLIDVAEGRMSLEDFIG